jgi:integrase
VALARLHGRRARRLGTEQSFRFRRFGRRRFAPHQLRHAHAVEMAREGVPLNVIQRQLGHANLGITSVYLEGIDNADIIDTVQARRAPMISANAGLRL